MKPLAFKTAYNLLGMDKYSSFMVDKRLLYHTYCKTVAISDNDDGG